MEVRPARPEDAEVLGRVTVEAWLSAHRGQMPDAVWQKRVEEWTPEVSARAWARLLAEQAAGEQPRTVLLVAEQSGRTVALVMASEEASGPAGTARVDALYVLPAHQGRGTGRVLLRSAAAELRALGFSRLRIGVLTANAPARAFYESMGGREVEQRTFDEEGVLLPETVYGWDDLTTLLPD